MDAMNTKKTEHTKKERYSGVWHGSEVSFAKTWGSHTFTEDEAARLLAGEKISFENDGYKVTGGLARQKYMGHVFVGFKRDIPEKNIENGYVSGVWRGRQVTFKRTWSEHTFTDEEVEKLLAGEKISFKAKNSEGVEYPASGFLATRIFNGVTFVGFQPYFAYHKKNVKNAKEV